MYTLSTPYLLNSVNSSRFGLERSDLLYIVNTFSIRLLSFSGNHFANIWVHFNISLIHSCEVLFFCNIHLNNRFAGYFCCLSTVYRAVLFITSVWYSTLKNALSESISHT